MAKEIGRLGKQLLEKRLRKHGWRPKRIDREREASNADIRALSLDGARRVCLKAQVSDADIKNRGGSIFFGKSGNYLLGSRSIFNSKPGSVIADIVVGVSYDSHDIESSRFMVMPVAFAEKLCRFHCEYQAEILKRAGKKRNLDFLMFLRFEKARSNHPEHDEKIISSLQEFENKWEILSEPISKLHDETAWDFPD